MLYQAKFDLATSRLRPRRHLLRPGVTPLWIIDEAQNLPREFVSLCGRLNGMSGQHLAREVERVIERVGIGYAIDRRVGALSKGMLQRTGFAAAIVHSPAPAHSRRWQPATLGREVRTCFTGNDGDCGFFSQPDSERICIWARPRCRPR